MAIWARFSRLLRAGSNPPHIHGIVSGAASELRPYVGECDGVGQEPPMKRIHLSKLTIAQLRKLMPLYRRREKWAKRLRRVEGAIAEMKK